MGSGGVSWTTTTLPQQVEEEDPGTPEKVVAQIGMGMLAVLPWGRR
jgi:hypothetical protein